MAVLHPFEIADGDAAGVGENVRDDENSLAINNRIGRGGGGTIGAFAENAGLHAICVLCGDLILNGGGHHNVAWLEKDFLRGHFRAASGKFRQRLALRVAPVNELGDVEALFVVEGAVDIGDADDLVTRFMHEHCAHRADIAEALHDDACLLALHAELGDSAFAGNHQTPASGFLAAARAAERERFAGDDGRGGVAHVHRVGVHDPGHGLLVGAQVRSWDVALGPDKLYDLRGIAAGNALDLAHGKLGRVADNTTLRAAKRNVNDGAFPGHPGRKRADFVESYVGSEADAALARPANDGVVDAIADKNFHVSVVKGHGDIHRNLLVGVLHIAVQAFFEP